MVVPLVRHGDRAGCQAVPVLSALHWPALGAAGGYGDIGRLDGARGYRMTEAQFQRQVCDLADRLGWTWWHQRISIGTREGFPDLLLLRHGRVLAAELKAGRYKTTPEQRKALRRFMDAGAEAVLWRPTPAPPKELWDGVTETSEEREPGDFGAIGRRLGLGQLAGVPVHDAGLAARIIKGSG